MSLIRLPQRPGLADARRRRGTPSHQRDALAISEGAAPPRRSLNGNT